MDPSSNALKIRFFTYGKASKNYSSATNSKTPLYLRNLSFYSGKDHTLPPGHPALRDKRISLQISGKTLQKLNARTRNNTPQKMRRAPVSIPMQLIEKKMAKITLPKSTVLTGSPAPIRKLSSLKPAKNTKLEPVSIHPATAPGNPAVNPPVISKESKLFKKNSLKFRNLFLNLTIDLIRTSTPVPLKSYYPLPRSASVFKSQRKFIAEALSGQGDQGAVFNSFMLWKTPGSRSVRCRAGCTGRRGNIKNAPNVPYD